VNLDHSRRPLAAARTTNLGNLERVLVGHRAASVTRGKHHLDVPRVRPERCTGRRSRARERRDSPRTTRIRSGLLTSVPTGCRPRSTGCGGGSLRSFRPNCRHPRYPYSSPRPISAHIKCDRCGFRTFPHRRNPIRSRPLRYLLKAAVSSEKNGFRPFPCEQRAKHGAVVGVKSAVRLVPAAASSWVEVGSGSRLKDHWTREKNFLPSRLRDLDICSRGRVRLVITEIICAGTKYTTGGEG